MCDNKRQLSAINLCGKKSNQNGYVLLHKFQDTRLSLNKIYLELFCYTVYGECYGLPHVTVFWTKNWLHLQHILYKGFYILKWMYVPLQGFVREYSENIPCHHISLTIPSHTPSAESVFWRWNRCSISSDGTVGWTRTAFWQQCKHLNSGRTHCSVKGHLAWERYRDSSFVL